MANIIFEHVGENYQVPGLPYPDRFKYVKPVVFDGIPTREDIISILESADKDTLANPWSIDVIRGFRDYIPTTFSRLTKMMPPEFIEEHFGLSGDWHPESDRVLLQLQTEVEAKGATIDAAIVHSRRDLGSVVNKVHLTNRIYNIGRLYGHLEKRDYPLLFGDLTNPSNWDQALSDVKMTFIDYMLELPLGRRKYARKVRIVDISKKELETRFSYLEWLKEKLGDNLIGVLLYGSAAQTDDPEHYSDFDNWVRVYDVQEAHKKLAGTNPFVLDDKVVEYERYEPPDAKHLGIHLFPESEEYLMRHIRFLHDSREFLKHTRVLYGEFPFWKIRQDEVVERGISAAYTKLKTIAGSLNWAYHAPERILDKQPLYEFIVKNLRFFLQHSLNAMERPEFRSKDDLNEMLAKRGLKIPKYKPDLEYIKESLLYSMNGVMKLQKELIDFNRKPRLRFLVDEKEYTWTSEELEVWEQFDED